MKKTLFLDGSRGIELIKEKVFWEEKGFLYKNVFLIGKKFFQADFSVFDDVYPRVAAKADK